MRREEIERLRLGSIIKSDDFLYMIVAVRNDDVGIISIPNIYVTKEQVIGLLRQGNISYFSLYAITACLFVKNTKVITSSDIVKLAMLGCNDTNYLTDKTLLEESRFCFGDQIEKLHAYTDFSGFVLRITNFSDLGYKINPNDLYIDLDYIKPDLYFSKDDAYRYMKKGNMIGLKVAPDKVGLLKEPKYDIRDVVTIGKIVDSKGFTPLKRDLADGYSEAIIRSVIGNVL